MQDEISKLNEQLEKVYQYKNEINQGRTNITENF